jgi:hypothetical protein
MKKLLSLGIISFTLFGCHKDSVTNKSCDIQQVYEDNEKKATITNGIWGTMAFMEGNCMPVRDPQTTTCKTCPVKRTIRIYAYTTKSQAVPQNFGSFYDSFNTQLIKEFKSDNNGFFQMDIPAGQYTIVVVENGKLYAFGGDGQGGISPITITGGKQKVNLTLTYKASF